MKIIFIHGRSQQGKDPAALKQEWTDTWARGLVAAGLPWPEGVEIELPFYGDKLDDLLKELHAPLVTDVMLRGNVQDSPDAAFYYDFLQEIANKNDISDADIQNQYRGGPQERGVLNWEWVQAILRAIDSADIMGDLSLESFTRDVYVYLTNPAVRKIIDGIVSACLTNEPCVVVGHSLGSIVGYNVLTRAQNSVSVNKYVTVGAPLGVVAVKTHLDRPLAMPACVRKGWYNARDDQDIVALRPLDSESFPITPLIENKNGVQNQTDNHHGIIGYLNDPDVARKIYEAL